MSSVLLTENIKIFKDVLGRMAAPYQFLIGDDSIASIDVQLWLPLAPQAHPLGKINITALRCNEYVVGLGHLYDFVYALIEVGLRLDAHPLLRGVFFAYHNTVAGTGLELPFSTHITYTIGHGEPVVTSLIFPMQSLTKWIPSAPFSVALPLAVSVAAHRAQSLVVGRGA